MLPFWVPRAELGSAPTRRLRDRIRAAAEAESNRLLYVALTRAADRLLVCGWEPGRKGGGALPPGCWYELCRQGFAAAVAETRPFTLGWPGDRSVLHHAAPAPASVHATMPPPPPPEPTPPDWIGRAPDWQAKPPPAEPALPQPLAPSRPDDVGLGPVPALRSPLGTRGDARGLAFRRGRLVHALLQHLPEVSPAHRAEAALRFLAAGPDGLDAGAAAAAWAQVEAVLAHPALSGLFEPGALAEQPISGLVGGTVITGQLDRLRVTPDQVTLCDFKTNRRTPASPVQVPVPYLRQMAAYHALLSALYPGRPLRCVLVWTQEAAVMPLPEPLLRAHAPGTYRLRAEAGAA